ncbi:MAG: tetratricopeptide repeat protein [Terriglobales bacterium]
MPPDEQLSAARLLADCGMSLHNDAITDQALNFLNQHFPDNPRVLYITSHFYSQMANRAAHRLLGTAPHSAPAQEMLAEAMEARGQWPQAEAAYRRLLRDHPAEPGIHYQLGRIILTRPFSAQVAAAAKHQFEAELKLDPHSSSTYFMLGELALRTRAWPEAIQDFQRSVGDNAAFTEADLGLGMALNGAGRYRAAVAPLRRYVAATPKDAAGHYQLALALGRSGHLAAAQREMAEVRRLAAAGRRPGANAAENQAQPH